MFAAQQPAKYHLFIEYTLIFRKHLEALQNLYLMMVVTNKAMLISVAFPELECCIKMCKKLDKL